MFIGYYSVANGVTLAGLVFSVLACMLSVLHVDVQYCIYLMFLSFLCDIFDGRLARRKKNRSAAAKLYGIQLDSLCDLVSFGITPCFIAYFSGHKDALDIIIYCLVVVCGAIRLAYFNTLAISNPEKAKEGYRGLPIPASMIVITFLFMLHAIEINPTALNIIFKLVFFGLGIGYVLNFKIKKSGLKGTIILITIEVLMLAILLFNNLNDKTLSVNDGNQSESSDVQQNESSQPLETPNESSDSSNESSDSSDSSDISDNSIDTSAVTSDSSAE
ncbi:MAG: CDP-alcohol phosphatidyltransferase family protein [Clostridia bacterium]|nr:CDP-alcohol phosphatidyltransferase family protein [Clostridia bacterium]